MPIYATSETKEFWQRCQSKSRSLAASRFVSLKTDKDGGEDKDWRNQSCDAIKAGHSNPKKAEAFSEFVTALKANGGAVVFAKLEARLIVDSAGGVLENGGICLDRTSGIPYIPGSAVKGAARHYAINELSEIDAEDTNGKATFLANICRVFGYGDQEWKSGRSGERQQATSDFWSAMVPLFDAGQEQDTIRDAHWSVISERAAEILIANHDWKINQANPLARQLPNLAGNISFLPAFPDGDPGIDIDVLTCHHEEYYSGKRDVATDDEDPIPVLFPTVAEGATFKFPLACNGCGARSEDLRLAKHWLTEALQTFGLGAKTRAGYGWFSIDETAECIAEKAAEAKQKKVKDHEAWESMTPEERVMSTLSQLEPSMFAEMVGKIADLPEDKQKALCRLLSEKKQNNWAKWNKPKAKRWQSRIPLIREIAKKHGIDLP